MNRSYGVIDVVTLTDITSWWSW